ncbi:MAG: lytic transglycosylase domain-containing protein [Gammaproteobacteria bacterium]|nr:lytic transglycosylase domain-containing protein [Gammaproteobacteria bacterium]MCP5439027.1 lytic transglycosylase domain-containing protein [Chromatiaceae bacterium]MCW5585620.1 lytic transglycosylase domain-containing protein [Chromatiales bacterium]MCB1818569.1 lytic transglycosylase domain-containing protein [Gammaproteobacteria bacterium]HOP15390.1 lytic transglycosylase domain-containing protein [Gammaproteobacteria bacterium]
MRFVIKTLLVGLACGVLLPTAATADVYKYRDARGRILLTDKPTSGMKLIKRYGISTGRSVGDSAATLAELQRRRDRLTPLIDTAADASNLRPALIHAVVRAESAYRSDAVSPKGAVGLMQLMPATAERYGVDDRHDPAENLRGGSTYLRDLLEMFDNDLQLALAAYNAGENAVIRYGNQIPPYDETQNYVRKVIGFYNAMIGGDQLALR